MRQSQRLLRLLLLEKFRFVAVRGSNHSELLLIAPYEYQRGVSCSPMLFITDNGGELNVGWVNRDDTMESIASTWHGTPLNAETMHYRIRCHLDGEPIDYDRRCEEIDCLFEVQITA